MAGSVRKHIDELRKQIEYHNYKYYVEAAPELSDREFDRLMQKLQELEKAAPRARYAGQSNAACRRPTPRGVSPGPPPRAHVVDRQHVQRGGPAQVDTRTRRLLKGEEPQYVVEQKIDGVSVTLLYEGGQLTLGATRRRHAGDDVTQNVRTIRDIPLRLRTDHHRGPQGAGGARRSLPDRDRAVAVESDAGGDSGRVYANTRNAAAGSLKLLDPRLCARRRLRFFAHSEGQLEGLRVATHEQFLDLVRAFGLPVVPHSGLFDSIDAVLAYCHEQLETRHAFEYEMDGLVVKVNDFAQRAARRDQPRTALGHCLQGRALAGEHADQGNLCASGQNGCVDARGGHRARRHRRQHDCRVSLFNADEIASKDIRIGDTVVVEKAGKVIPHVVPVDWRSGSDAKSAIDFR